MGISSSSATSAGTTKIHFIYQTSTTSSSSSDVCWYSDPIARWLDIMDELYDAATQRQRAAWFAPQKVRVVAPVPPVRRYQKSLQKQRHPFPPGKKK